MIEWLQVKIDELTVLVQTGFTLAAIVVVGIAYWKTRTLVALLGAGLTAGIFVWSLYNVSWWQDRVGDETEIEVEEGQAPAGGDAAVDVWVAA